MRRSSFELLTKPHHTTRTVVPIAVATLLALAACSPQASPAPTSSGGPSRSAIAAPSPVVVSPSMTPDVARPPGVPSDAQPLLFGCQEGVARCTDIAPGTYYTAGVWALLPGLTFTLAAGWSSLANEAGELELHPVGDDHDEILVWRDVVPWQHGRAVVNLALDPAAWAARLASDPCLKVAQLGQVALGHWIDLRGGQSAELRATTVSVGVAAKAPYEKANCPASGKVDILSDPMHWEHAFTIGGDEMNDPGCPCRSVQRLYFASIGYAQHKHLLVVALQSYGPIGDVDAQMARLRAAAQPVLDSLIAPAIVVDN